MGEGEGAWQEAVGWVLGKDGRKMVDEEGREEKGKRGKRRGGG